MNKRSTAKEASFHRILKSGAARLREKGLSGAAIPGVMKDAGLTHGTFYSHFKSKGDLLIASLAHALAENRVRWTSSAENDPWPQRVVGLARRYLTADHRDHLSDSCALAALVSEAARSDSDFRRAYEKELCKTLDAVCGGKTGQAEIHPEKCEDAIMLMSLCIGGLNLSRAVDSRDLSDEILAVCCKAAERMSGRKNLPDESRSSVLCEKNRERASGIEEFPIQTFEKLRYRDTDRQGHVNNAVFSTMLETGRVEILCNPESFLSCPGCSFVIARQELDFYAEISWPGRVDIGTRVVKTGRSSITLDQALFQERRCRAGARTVIVQINEATKQPEPLSRHAKDRLHRLRSQCDPP